jgi:hypothetical protein
VELSVDGGATWLPAEGTSEWRLESWTPESTGRVILLSRAVDTHGNREVASAGIEVMVVEPPQSVSFWSTDDRPTTSLKSSQPLELGMKFRTTTAGQVTAIRYYHGSLVDTSRHVGHLWSESGELLASVSFAPAASAGWQVAQLNAPVELTAGAMYVVSQFSPTGHYVSTPWYFSQPDTQGVLYAPSDDESGGNGVFATGGQQGHFPSKSGRGTNYWVDVVFQYTPES